jgi:hypothetical protein
MLSEPRERIALRMTALFCNYPIERFYIYRSLTPYETNSEMISVVYVLNICMKIPH